MTYKQMNRQGAGAKIKEISHKIILKFLIQGLHHPYTLPSKGEIVPPISIMINENNEIILSPQHRIVNHGSRILIESLSIRVLVRYIMFIVITRNIQK